MDCSSLKLEKYVGSQVAIQDHANGKVYRGQILDVKIVKDSLEIMFQWLMVMDFGWKPFATAVKHNFSLEDATINEDDGVLEVELFAQKKKLVFFPADYKNNFKPEDVASIFAPAN